MTDQQENYRCVEILHEKHEHPFEGYEIVNAMKQYGKEQYNQAIRDASEKAKKFAEFYIDDKGTENAIKDSILKLLKP